MLKIKDVMQSKVLKVPPDLSVGGLVQLLESQMITGAPVVDDDNHVLGIVSLSDVAHEANRTHGEVMRVSHGAETDLSIDHEQVPFATVREIMNPVVYEVEEDYSVAEVIRFMLFARIHRAVVVRDQEVVGIVSTTDFTRLLLEMLEKK